LLARVNPAMQDGVELTGTDEEKMMLFMAAQTVGLKIKNPPATTPDEKLQKSFMTAMQKVGEFIQKQAPLAAAAAAATTAEGGEEPGMDDVDADEPEAEAADELAAPDDDDTAPDHDESTAPPESE